MTIKEIIDAKNIIKSIYNRRRMMYDCIFSTFQVRGPCQFLQGPLLYITYNSVMGMLSIQSTTDLDDKSSKNVHRAR